MILYVCYGGCIKVGGKQDNLIGTNDFRVIPAAGGSWRKFLSTDAPPPIRFGQTMHHDPAAGFFMLGGIDDTAPQNPEMFFPVINRNALPNRAAWRKPMTANTWAAISANTLSSIDPANDSSINPNGAGTPAPWHPPGGGGAQGSIVTAWNSATYDDLTHTMHLDACGGHSDYGGNESYKIALDVAAPTWVMTRKPTGAVGNTGNLNDGRENTGVYFDGRPRSSHTYNYPAYVPGMGPVITRTDATAFNSGDARKVWKFHPESGAPTLLKDYTGMPNTGSEDPVGASCYDPVRRCIWTLYAGPSQLQKLNCVSNVVTTHGPVQNWGAGVMCATYLPEVDALLLVSRPAVRTWIPARRDCQLSISGLSRRQRCRMVAHSPQASRWSSRRSTTRTSWLGWRGTRLDTGSCFGTTRRTERRSAPSLLGKLFHKPVDGRRAHGGQGNAVAPTVAALNGTYGRFAYSPSYDGVFLLNNVADPVFLLRVLIASNVAHGRPGHYLPRRERWLRLSGLRTGFNKSQP
jgi:hypothetical protein